MLPVTREAIHKTVLDQIERLDFVGRSRYGIDVQRRISLRHEMAYRLCHHDFCGLSMADAAEVMDTSPACVRKLLGELREIAPQLFPILTPYVGRVYALYVAGFSATEIAEQTNRSVRSVQAVLQELRDREDEVRLHVAPIRATHTRFESWMEDEQVVSSKF